MAHADPAPLTWRQARALSGSVVRELGWGLRAVRAEATAWRARAEAIPDADVRREALAALAQGRPLIDGAALFWTLPTRRRHEVLRLFVALQCLLNHLDVVFEREALGPQRRAGRWMWLVEEALDITRPSPEVAIARAVGDDGGYLAELVLTCRAGCAALPRYADARPLLLREVARSRSFEIEHDRDAPRRNARIEEHAAQAFVGVSGALPWELVGGASSLLTAMAVLALAADRDPSGPDDLEAAADAYVWVASAAALMDSYADRPADRVSGGHNWLDYYDSDDEAARRAMALLSRAAHEVSVLPRGERHLVIVACMAALALSSDAARRPEQRATTAALARSGGALTRSLVPVLRAWRLAYGRPGD